MPAHASDSRHTDASYQSKSTPPSSTSTPNSTPQTFPVQGQFENSEDPTKPGEILYATDPDKFDLGLRSSKMPHIPPKVWGPTTLEEVKALEDYIANSSRHPPWCPLDLKHGTDTKSGRTLPSLTRQTDFVNLKIAKNRSERAK
ncbi:MAG: hypothetical protein M1814_006038 [Vezdaea aestivalis]|nr:MAG: hypothetical protein M1814_006038 [Vezdaea aestivalis]